MNKQQEFIDTLSAEFKRHGNASIAKEQKRYMKNHFAFFGMHAATRRKAQQPFLVKQYLPAKQELFSLVKALFSKPERDFHHFAQELVFKYHKQFDKADIELIEYMVTHNSWWDSVDFIASKIAGSYFMKFPEEREAIVQKWLDSGNMWLQRTALLFQLKYKKELDTKLLAHTIKSLLDSKEFFINKAIGWVLREYGKTDPDWVMDFVANHALAPLSKREATRIILTNCA